MRQIACARCGRRVPVKCGVMPRRCTCGEEFEWAPLDGPGSLAVVLLAFALLMSFDSCPHMVRAAASSRFHRPVRCGLDCRLPLALRMRDAARSFWFGADGASNIPSLPRSMRRFA